MILAPALVALALAARPDWVDGMPAAFPRERYLVAVGSADARADAELRARAGIAASFESRLAAASQVKETEAAASAGGAVLRVASIAASQEVTAVTARLLEGVEIADAWAEPGGRSWALAVLDRARAVEVLRRRLSEVDAEVGSLAGRLAAERAGFARARLAHRIVVAAARRTPIVADLRILDPAAEAPAPKAAAEARAAAERALGDVAVAVRADGEAPERLAPAAARAVVATGMRSVGPDAAHDLLAAVATEAAPAATVDGWSVVRLSARVRLLAPDGAVVVTFVESAKGTSGAPGEAARRAADALAGRVEERLHAELRTRLEEP